VEEAAPPRGIIIPDSAKDKRKRENPLRGRGKSNDEGKVFPLAVKEGDRVLFASMRAEIKIDGEDWSSSEGRSLGILSGAPTRQERNRRSKSRSREKRAFGL